MQHLIEKNMLRQLSVGLIFFFIVCCKNKTLPIDKVKAADTSLKILTYGLANIEQQRAMNTLAKKYSFHYYSVAGCIVSKQLLDSVDKENDKVYNILKERYGKDWRLTFATEVDTMQKLQHDVEELVKKERYIRDKERELWKEENGLDYLINPTTQTNIFTVKVYGWGTWNGESELLVYYKLSVDLNKKRVKLTSSTPERLYNRS